MQRTGAAAWATGVLVTGLLAFHGSARADSPVNPTTIPGAVPMTGQEQENVRLVLDWWREVIEGGHLELVPHYQAETYIQHNPNINTGRAGFLEAFGKDNSPVNPIPAKLKSPPPLAGARGEYVWVLWERRRDHPPTPLYYQNRFELLRVRNGQVQEHWDADRKEPGSGVVHFGSTPRPPTQFDTGAALTPAERATRKIAIQAATQLYLHRRLELADRLIASDYIEHDPNLARETTTRARLGAFQPPSGLQGDEPAVAIVNGEYVLMMWDLSSPDPDDATRTYPWNYFQLVRVRGGKVVEHWDQDALKG